MKKGEWVLLGASAVLYCIPFLWSDYFWWVIFIFPVPLFSLICFTTLSFIHGYIWGCCVFALHMCGGIYVMAAMAHEWWFIGIGLGIMMILYHALWSGVLFAGASFIIEALAIKKVYLRLLVWLMVLWIFSMGIDWYSLWIVGVVQGYPLMHPLIVLAKKPQLLYLLPLIGKQSFTILFLAVPASIVMLEWYQNCYALFFASIVIMPWLLRGWVEKAQIFQGKQICIKSLPQMICSENPFLTIKIIKNSIKKVIQQCSDTNIIIMPESACSFDNFSEVSELLSLWDENNMGKPIHVIFGASRCKEGHYYNSLHWVYNGVLQHCFDKRHAMILSEQLPWFLDNSYFQAIYFPQGKQVAASRTARKYIKIDEMCFVPYICSELFFNENPDDNYDSSIIVMVNDSVFLSSTYSAYISKILLLLARFKAIQWQRDIIYVSYAYAVWIDKQGNSKDL